MIVFAGLSVVILITVKNLAKGFVTYWITRFGASIETYFGEILLNGFLKLPYEWHITCNSADLVNAVQWRLFLGRSFIKPCLDIFNNILMVAIMLTVLFIVQPIISLIVFVVLGSSAGFIYIIIKKKIDQISTVAKDYQIFINKETTMAIHGVKDVKISRKENNFVQKFVEKAIPLSKIFGLLTFFSASPVLILETIGFGMLCSSICWLLIFGGASTAYVTGTMTLLAVTAWKALPAVNQILGSITIARNALPYISNQIQYFTLIEKENGSSFEKNDSLFSFEKTIKFKNVSFSYQKKGRQIIQDISFEINKGETIGIIGTSGAGKSTLVDLLIGLLKPTKGHIYIDDQALTVELLSNWLSVTGYVPQSPYIFDGTLAENVAFGIDSGDINRDRVRNSCKMAAMDDFLYDLPENIDSYIGERGIKLSGGQQQRVSIARALYNQPEIMIFDEATSSLDSKSEKSILKTIYSFKGRQTLFIIAHRLSSVKDCDKVIWIEKGRIRMIEKPDIVLKAYGQMTVPKSVNQEKIN
ncbi:MAG: ABC transporter ATP-binding protein [Pseudomonadota bacterium]